MKILFLSHNFSPENNALAVRVHGLARAWVQAGHWVTVVTDVPNMPAGVVYQGYRNRLYQRESLDGIEVVRVWTYVTANQGTVKRSLSFVSYLVTATMAGLLRRPADVVNATSPQLFAGWAGLAVARAHRRPYVLEIRDLWPESITAVGAMHNGPLIRALDRAERRLYRWSPTIVTVGAGYRERLVEQGVPEDKIAVVPNGFDKELFHPRDAGPDVRRRWGIPAGDFVCGYAGTIGMAANLGIVVRAAKLLQEKGRADVTFLLVGDGAERKKLAAAARAQGLDKIVFTGLQPHLQIPELLAACDACLAHFRKDELFTTTLPAKFFENAAMAKPIILGFRGHAEQLLRDADCGLAIEPDNEHELVSAVETLAADPDLCRRLGQNGLEYVLDRHEHGRLAGEYALILERAVAAHRGG
jgi:glycosyltransferase involved in cell wall biosynthesis